MPKLSDFKKPAEACLGLWLDDVAGLGADLRIMLRLAERLDLRAPARVGSKATDVVVPFRCPLLEAAVCVDVLQSEQRQVGLPEARVYLLPPGGQWRRVSARVMTTAGGKELNPEVFGARAVDSSDIQPPSFVPVRFGQGG